MKTVAGRVYSAVGLWTFDDVLVQLALFLVGVLLAVAVWGSMC